MFITYRIIALSFVLGVCFALELPNLEVKEYSNDVSGLERLLTPIVRRIVTGMVGNSIKIHETKINNLETSDKNLLKLIGLTNTRLSFVERRLSRARTICHEKETAWSPYSGAPIMYLDRQAVTCPQGYFLSRFHLVRQANRNKAPVRYLFRCCKFSL